MQMDKIKFGGIIAAQTRALRDVTIISCTDGDQDDVLIKHACVTVHGPFYKLAGFTYRITFQLYVSRTIIIII